MQTPSNKAQENGQLDIMQLIKEQDEYVVGALMTLYSYQEYDEQTGNCTIHDNNLGFNSFDSTILSSMAKYYQNNGLLTPKQIAFVRRTIPKYHNQLISADVKPLPIKNKKTQEQNTKSIKWAGSLDGGKKILVKFRFPKGDPQFRETLDKVKTLSGRKWNPDLDDKPWSCYCTIDNLENLMKWGFDVAPKLQEWYEKMNYSTIEKNINIPDLGMELYPFQKDGVAFVNSRRGRALIGDCMGLGKTAQALAWLQFNKETALPALVICPASVKLNWERERKMWTPDLTSQLISGRTPTKIPDADIIISNYDILADREIKDKEGNVIETIPGWASSFKKSNKLKTIIIDEIHYLKESKTLRTKAVRKLAKGTPHIIGLSGTPITNRPQEFFNCLSMIAPERFPSFWEYVQRYCGAKHNGFGWDFSGSSHASELHEKVCHIMIRRKKEDVLKDLPPKTRSVIPLEIDNRSEYKKAEEDFIGWVKETHGNKKAIKAENAQALAQIEGLKQLTIDGKMNSVIEWITDFLDSGQKLVVFCTHHKTIDDLMTHFKGKKGAVKLDGRDSLKARQTSIDAFQSLDNIRLFIGNIKAAGIGITLTAASATCFIELLWNSADADQAEDRVHRIGQEADCVIAYYLLAHDTIEEEIAEMIDAKRKILDQVLDGQKTDETSMLSELLNKMIDK